KKSGNKKQTHSVFASADEFAEILQDAGASGKKAGGAGALATKDNAGVKQLHWETARDFWLNKGRETKHKKRNGGIKKNKLGHTMKHKKGKRK
ncbi:unnamed protein product, partial [Timema podura]|nr:unnamed protein product [Timema podura]